MYLNEQLMAKNPAKQFNLGIHKIPSFRFHFFKKHTTPPKTRGFNPRCSRRFLSMAWPSSCFRQTSRWSLAMSKANRQDPQEVKLNHADLPPPKTPRKTWSVFVLVAKTPSWLGVKGFQQKRGSLSFPVIKGGFTRLWDVLSPCEFLQGRFMSGFGAPKQTKWPHFVGRRVASLKVWENGGFCPTWGEIMLEKDEGWLCGGGFCVCMYLVTRCGQEPLPSWCFVPIFSQLKNSVLTILRSSSKSFKRFHSIFHCRVSNLASVSPGEQPQTIIHRNRHVFLWDRIPTNPHPFSVGFLWRSGNFSGSMLSGYIASKFQNKRGSTGTGISFL